MSTGLMSGGDEEEEGVDEDGEDCAAEGCTGAECSESFAFQKKDPNEVLLSAFAFPLPCENESESPLLPPSFPPETSPISYEQ